MNGKAVGSADRPQRLATLAHQGQELEEREEALILSAERDGLDLDRRADAPAAAVVCTVLADAA